MKKPATKTADSPKTAAKKETDKGKHTSTQATGPKKQAEETPKRTGAGK